MLVSSAHDTLWRVSQQASSSSEGVGAKAVPEATPEAKNVSLPKYESPAVQIDPQSGLAVIVVRSGDTGVVQSTIPSQTVVREYRRHGGGEEPVAPNAAQQAAVAQAPAAQPPDQSPANPSAAPAVQGVAADGHAMKVTV